MKNYLFFDIHVKKSMNNTFMVSFVVTFNLLTQTHKQQN